MVYVMFRYNGITPWTERLFNAADFSNWKRTIGQVVEWIAVPQSEWNV